MPRNLPKIIAGSSALISLAHGQLLELILKEFDIVISTLVFQELEQTSKFDDPDGHAAQRILDQRDLLNAIEVSEDDFRSYLGRKVHAGEASCLALAHQQDADAFICDDFDALPYLDFHSRELGIEVGLCPVLIQALILRGKITRDEGRAAFDRIAKRRNWLGRPLYEYGKKLLEK